MTQVDKGHSEVVDGIEYRYSSDWIHQLESEEHWRSYWHQLKLVLPELKKGDTILEIGPGSGFLTNYLRAKGYQVTTLDIDQDKSPDIVANLVVYDFPEVYDHIFAFEVFEHIPFEKFTDSLPRLKIAARKNLFFSVPRNYRIWFHADLIIPYFKEVTFSIKTRRRKILTQNHFWELDYKKYRNKFLLKVLEDAEFTFAAKKSVKTMAFYHFRSSV